TWEAPGGRESRGNKFGPLKPGTAREMVLGGSGKVPPPPAVAKFRLTAGVPFARGAMTRDGWWAIVQHPGTTLKCGIFIGNTRGENRAVQEGAPRCWAREGNSASR